jgi:hypothetical protein
VPNRIAFGAQGGHPLRGMVPRSQPVAR